MALPQNPYAQYKNSGILTATPGDLVLKLYDGMIRYTNLVRAAVAQENSGAAHENLLKAQRIIDHLLATLDPKYEISKEFENIYLDFLSGLVRGNANKDLELLDTVLEKMRMVRDNWKEVMKKVVEDSQ